MTPGSRPAIAGRHASPTFNTCRLHRARRVTGILFVLVGIYFSLRFISGVPA